MSRRVVVTGLGVLSALGEGVETFWQGLLGGETAIREANEALGNRKKASPATESEKPKTSP